MTDDAFSSSAVREAVAYLKARLPFRPRVGIVLGSGLGGYADRSPMHLVESYQKIPGFPPCSVEGHQGRLVVADRCGVPVVMLQGRAHRYEGLTLEAVTRPVRVLADLGVDTLILTCAAGGLTEGQTGTLMFVQDHLNLMGDNPLIAVSGERKESVEFTEMADAYDPALLDLADHAAKAMNIPVHRGVLACVPGPTYETPAEAAMLKQLGAHAVCMSTVPEVIVARALNLRVLAFALITNQSGVRQERTSAHHRVVSVAESKAKMVEIFLDRILTNLARA